MNFIMLQGNLCDKPVYRTGQNGKQNSVWGKIGVWQGKDQNGNDLPSLFVEFTAFGKDADTIGQLANKGDLVVVSGRFQETQSQGNNGQVYMNKKVVGNAKLCQKLAPQTNQYQQPTQPQYQQPMQQQQYQAPQQNANMWG